MTRVWLITGAARGLGQAFTEAAVGAGDSVIATARTREALDGLVSGHGSAVFPLVLDVRDREAVQGRRRRWRRALWQDRRPSEQCRLWASRRSGRTRRGAGTALSST